MFYIPARRRVGIDRETRNGHADDNSSSAPEKGEEADFGKSVLFTPNADPGARVFSTRRFAPRARRRTCFQPPRVDVPRAWPQMRLANVARKRLIRLRHRESRVLFTIITQSV